RLLGEKLAEPPRAVPIRGYAQGISPPPVVSQETTSGADIHTHGGRMESTQEPSLKRRRRRRKRRVCGYRTLKRAPRMRLGAPTSFAMYWLKRAERQVSSRLARELKELNLIPSEWHALRAMYESARTSPLALARSLNMTKGGASKLICRLVKKKLVRKKVSHF